MTEKKEEIMLAHIENVTTQTMPVIYLEDGRQINELELIVEIYNKILKLEKAVI